MSAGKALVVVQHRVVDVFADLGSRCAAGRCTKQSAQNRASDRANRSTYSANSGARAGAAYCGGGAADCTCDATDDATTAAGVVVSLDGG